MPSPSWKWGPPQCRFATRFTAARECGLPKDVQQEYFKAGETDIEVNTISPPVIRCAC